MEWTLGSFQVESFDTDTQDIQERTEHGIVSDNGHFGIFRRGSDALYTLVHIASKRYISQYFWSAEKAKAAAQRLATMDVEWDNPHPLALLSSEDRTKYEILKED